MEELHLKLGLNEPWDYVNQLDTAVFKCRVIHAFVDTPRHYLVALGDFLLVDLRCKVAVVRNRYGGEDALLDLLKQPHHNLVVAISLLPEGHPIEKKILSGDRVPVMDLDVVHHGDYKVPKDWKHFIGSAELI
jgi:hypothetical protein